MIKHKSYVLSGQGVTPKKTLTIINLLRDNGVRFISNSARGGHGAGLVSGMYLFPADDIDENTKAKCLAALALIGLKQVRLEKVGQYEKR